MANPTLIPEAFAASALPANITSPVPDTPTGTNAASWKQGFPPITMTPKASGGQPPLGADMNGVINAMSQHTVFLQQGGCYFWDATFGASPGYAKGAILLLNDLATTVVSNVASNTANPNLGIGGGTGWQAFAGTLALVANSANATGTANAIVVTLPTTPSTPGGVTQQGTRVAFRAILTNTSIPVTLSVNGVTTNLTRNDVGGIRIGDIVSGGFYEVIWNSIYGGWQLLTPVPSQTFVPIVSTLAGIAQSTTSASLVMAGLAFTYTPAASCTLLVTLQGNVYNATAASSQVQLQYGTGAPPAHGVAMTGGTLASSLLISVPANAGVYGVPFCITVPVTGLIRGTAYWFDLAFSTIAGTLTLAGGAQLSILEF